MNKQSPLLTACLIVKNEAAQLPRCLGSLRGIADELIVVDTGSTDSTKAIAQRFGAIVKDFKWQNDFAKARNFALQHATGQWILSIDADEELPAQTQQTLRGELQAAQGNAFMMVVRNLLPDHELTQYTDSKIIRLFENNPCHRFSGRIHEQVGHSIQRAGGSIQDIDLKIIHHGYRQKSAQGESRAHRNLGLLLDMVAESPSDAYVHYQLGLTYRSLGQSHKADACLSKAVLNNKGHLSISSLERAYITLAQLAMASGQNKEAIARARAGLRLNPKNTIGLYVLGLCAFSAGDLVTAQISFGQLLQNEDINAAQIEDVKVLLGVCKQGMPTMQEVQHQMAT